MIEPSVSTPVLFIASDLEMTPCGKNHKYKLRACIDKNSKGAAANATGGPSVLNPESQCAWKKDQEVRKKSESYPILYY